LSATIKGAIISLLTSNDKDWKYKTVKVKAYFDKGYGLTHYIKYVIAIFGITSNMLGLTMFIVFLYIPVCFLIGWWWLNHGWYTREIEVGNEFNQFVGEMRKAIGKRKA